jgi:hypothetical protein
VAALGLWACGNGKTDNGKPPANVAVTPADTQAWQQPSMAQDPAKPDRLVIGYQEGSLYQSPICGVATMSNSGAAWKPRALVGLGGQIPLPEGFDVCTDPKVAFGPGGVLLYLYQVLSQKTFASYLFVTSSTDGGATFGPPHQLDASAPLRADESGSQEWYPVIASRGNTVAVAFFRFGAGGSSSTVLSASSTDGGRTFSAPVALNPSAQPTSSCDTAVAITPDGAVHVAWVDNTVNVGGCGTTPKTFTCPGVFNVSTSRDNGHTFAQPAPVRSNLNLGCPGPDVLKQLLGSDFQGRCDPLHYGGYPFSFPLVSGRGKSELFVSWWEGDPQGPARVFVAHSQDGSVWSDPVQLPSPTAANDQQHRPALALAPNGRLDVVFYNRASGGQDVFRTSSKDGRRFDKAVKLTDRPSDPTIGNKMFNGVTQGEFLAVSSRNDSVAAAWTDTRRGNNSTAKQDVFFARQRM